MKINHKLSNIFLADADKYKKESMETLLYFGCLIILAYLVAKIIFYAKLEHKERKKNAVKNKTENNDMPAFIEAQRTYNISNFITSYVKTEANIKSDLVIFEIIIFFNFLERLNFKVINAADSIKKNYLPLLKTTLQHENKVEYERYKDKFEKLINTRNLIYWKLMRKYNEKITKNFLQDAFRFLSEQIHYIAVFDDLSEEIKDLLTLQEWNEKVISFEKLKTIYDVLNKNYELIMNFINKNAIDNSLQ